MESPSLALQVTTCVNYKQKNGRDHHNLIKETVDLWRNVCKDNQETMTWFRTTIAAMVEEFIITEDNEVFLRLHSTIAEYINCQRPENMDPDPEMETALTALRYLRREAKYTVKRWCEVQP
jgi:hypothetical protein